MVDCGIDCFFKIHWWQVGVVLPTGPGNPPAIMFLAGGSVRFSSRPGQKPDPLSLGGFVTQTRHKPAGFWPDCTQTAVPFQVSYNFGTTLAPIEYMGSDHITI